MGKLTTLVIGQKSTMNITDTNTKYFNVFATVDLGKVYDSAVSKLCGDISSPIHMYAPCGDGNTEITKDKYDNVLCPIPAKDVIAALRRDTKYNDHVRFEWALQLLKAIGSDDVHVILFNE